jgi:signal transduction histidine kinase
MAIRNGGDPPQLHLGATSRSSGNVRFWVRDNGPGLSAAQISNLFSPYQQPGNVRDLGLGLSVVKRITEKLNGEVGVESDGIAGNGCIYYFTLPIAEKP